MTKSKNSETVTLRYVGYLEHYERATHLQSDGSVDRPPTPAERFASSNRIVDDLQERRGIDQPPVEFNFENDFQNTVNREAADWLVKNEPGEWVIVGEASSQDDQQVIDSES